ncbi:MAG: hypothetical protein AAF846_19815 [Chloroflexota bacterium]
MSENQLNRQLAAGIRAAQQGNRERARELLEGVLRQDRNNEQAWIWLASVVESQRERRLSLERVLKINPSNTAAQDALNSMVGVLGESASIDYAAISASARTPAPVGGNRSASPAERAGTSEGGSSNLLPFLFGGAIILGVLLIGSIFIPPLLAPAPTETPTEVAILPSPTGPTVDPSIPTSTNTAIPTATFDSEAVGAIATNTPSGPTFTPTATFTPSNTPVPSATLPSVLSYSYVVLGSQGSNSPGVFELSGDGTMVNELVANVGDFDFNPATGALVYTQIRVIELPTVTPIPTFTPSLASPEPRRTQQSSGGLIVSPNSGQPLNAELSQMFVTNINDLETRVEITNSTLQNAIEPAISPDGAFIIFASDIDGDFELFLYDVSTGLSDQITDNSISEDTQPSWSADGELVIFSSDRVSAANNDIFTIDPFASDPESTVEQITDARGQAQQPQLSPDQSQIVFLNTVQDSSAIRLATADGSSVRDLTFQASSTYGPPVWTLDGNYIVYSVALPDETDFEFRIYSPLTGDNRAITVNNFSTLRIVPRS